MLRRTFPMPVLLMTLSPGAFAESREAVPTATAAAANERSEPSGYDIWIRGGTVIDGSGGPGVRADVLIRGERIARVGQFTERDITARHVIDATGRVVTPGFIDTHSHGDPLKTPAFDNFLAMGVTTICLGQDGESPSDPGTWMQRVEEVHPGVNVALFIGHGTVREQAGVNLDREPKVGQIEAMQKLVRQAMDAGCFGMSTGLEYQPGMMADLKELVALAEPVAAAGGLVMSHMRSEDDDAIEGALNELLAQGFGSGCPVHVSHIKVTYGHGAARAERVLARMAQARSEGICVTADIYPYCASYTGIGIVFPEWAKPPNNYRQVVSTRRAELAEYLRRRVMRRNGPEATLLGTRPWTGKTLAQVAQELKKPFEDVLIDDIGLHGAQAAYFVMDPALQDRLLIDDHVMICTDGGPTSQHPRGHGAFARVIRDCVVERKLLSLEAAVHKMTGLPASAIGLDRLGRGRIAEGLMADVLVFDPRQVRDHATYEQPRVPASGLECVIVNGRVVRRADQATGGPAGRVLRRAERTWEQTVDDLLRPLNGQVPGASVAVVQDGKVILEKSCGLADLPGRTPATPQTNYRLASVTKQFTAMCIMMLQERGLLRYDDPVARYLPEMPASTRGVTLRHLLGHTSGLIDYEDIIPADRKTPLKDRDVLDLLSQQDRTYFEPGSQYRYSNSGYALLALIVERVSRVSFATFLRENIFLPLGMNDTVAYETGISTVSRRAMGYRHTNGGFVDADQSMTSAVLGDGGIYTSLTDYRRWEEALSGTKLVKRETREEAFTPGRLPDGTSTGYGFGWSIRQAGATRIIAHDGSTCGFSTAVRRVPDRRLAVIVLTNRAEPYAPRIADELLRCLLNGGQPGSR